MDNEPEESQWLSLRYPRLPSLTESTREAKMNSGLPRSFTPLRKNHMLQEPIGSAPSEALRQQVDPSQPTMTETSSFPAGDALFMSPRELARLLRVTTDCIYRLVAKQALPAYRILRRILLRRSDIERWLESHRTKSLDRSIWQSEK